MVCAIQAANGQVVLIGSPYQETFDVLPTASSFQNLDGQWQDNATLPGWYRTIVSDGTPGVENRWRVDNGGASGGSLYSYGSFGSTDRALGFVPSSNLATIHIGVRLVNGAAEAIDEIDVTYFGEQWRQDSANQGALDFAYRLGQGALVDGEWTRVADLDFLAPWHSMTPSALNGNLPVNQNFMAARISGLSWQPGEELWLRWTGENQPMPDQGLAVDDLTVTIVPEPGTLLALAAGLGLLARRRLGSTGSDLPM